MQYQKEDTEVVVSLPENSQRYVPSKINNRRNRGNFLLGTKDLDWYPKQISNRKYQDEKKNLCWDFLCYKQKLISKLSMKCSQRKSKPRRKYLKKT